MMNGSQLVDLKNIKVLIQSNLTKNKRYRKLKDILKDIHKVRIIKPLNIFSLYYKESNHSEKIEKKI